MAITAAATRPLAGLAPSRLAQAQRGRQQTARRMFIFGDGGLGKTTLAAGAPRPIWIDINQGSLGFDVARYTFDEVGRTKPDTFEEVLAALGDIARNGKDFGAVVIDVLSDLEQLIFVEVVKADKKAASIAEVGGGYDKGYVAAVDYWRRVLNLCEDCWRAGLHVVFLDHSDVKKEKNAGGADYGRGMPKIHPLASKLIHTWSDYTLFLEIEKTLVPDNPDQRKAKKEYAISDGKRLLHARPAAEYMAKSRPELADPIELPNSGGWQLIDREIAAAQARRVEELRASIEARLAGLGDKDQQAVAGMLERAGEDDSKLEQLDNWCAGRPARKE